MGLIAELRKMHSFWKEHHFCEGVREVQALGMYMLWCPVHKAGETTGYE